MNRKDKEKDGVKEILAKMLANLFLSIILTVGIICFLLKTISSEKVLDLLCGIIFIDAACVLLQIAMIADVIYEYMQDKKK
jgi:hypothetical protein